MTHNVKDFIFWEFIENIELCDKIIDLHNNSKLKFKGTVGSRHGSVCDPSKKESIESIFSADDSNIYGEYRRELNRVVSKYIEIFPMCNNYSPWAIAENIKIQHYAPGQGFKEWHTERSTNIQPLCARHIVFMTYLNDITDDGETEFYHQKLKIAPKKGLTVIWPADWTHTHRGIVSSTQEKYIVTGWYNYITPPMMSNA